MVGRKREVAELNRLYNSGESELVAIYGRRRVGKTYLVDEVFANRITFRHAGMSPAEGKFKGALEEQLNHFYLSLQLHNAPNCKKPKNWMEAFFQLEKYLTSIDDGKRQVVFFDELPWMDTYKSGFIRAFEAFWNTWACHRKNLIVIICGSANSWIIDNLINNHGGLYNRVTYEIKLEPFTLNECEELLISRNIKLSRYDIAQAYMILGGIPYYLRYFEPGDSLSQSIDKLFYDKTPKLASEFDRLFSSVFKEPEAVKKIVKVLFKKNEGLTRSELSEKTGIKDGGVLTKYINALIASDFITKYYPFGKTKKQPYYKLVDPFCMFYLKFVEGHDLLDFDFWQKNVVSQSITSWRGFAFESIAFNHINQIKRALGIESVISSESAWVNRDDAEGTQIDLLISRNDNILNMCEIKFYSGEFSVDKSYYLKLMDRENALSKVAPKKAAIHSTLITTYGLKYNEYSSAFSKVITLDDLFK
jgi:AAA+ ATPase superfamily predicted ATPase